MRDVAELVRDHEAHLLVAEALEERVVEHDPLRVAEPSDVRVDRIRPPRRVHDEHIAQSTPDRRASSSTSVRVRLCAGSSR